MSKIDIWTEQRKLTDRLANVFELEKITLEETEQIVDLLCRFAQSTNGKESIMRALNRERRLMIYQQDRKLYSHSRSKYLTTKNKALQKIRETRQNIIINETEHIYFVFQSTIDFWTEEFYELSRTTKWRIRKELELDDIRIIQEASEITDFS